MSDLYIETRGHGAQHIVLLHGWAMHGGVFAPLTDALAQVATVHLVDLPGHGNSHDSRLPLTLDACVEAIAAATPPAVWLGWSLGGLMALAGALNRPDRVTGLAMVDTSPCMPRKPDWPQGQPPEVFVGFGRDLTEHYRVTVERFLALEAMGSAHANADTRRLRAAVFARPAPAARVFDEGLALIEHTDLRARLRELTQPSVWLVGARDRLIGVPAMQWSAEQCGGHFEVIPHAGHAPFIGFTDAVTHALMPLLTPAIAVRKQA